jgi:hypothetical protein
MRIGRSPAASGTICLRKRRTFAEAVDVAQF